MSRIPNPSMDPQIDRCGHNFWVTDCPYEFCGYRDTLTILRELVDSLASATDAAKRRADQMPIQKKDKP